MLLFDDKFSEMRGRHLVQVGRRLLDSRLLSFTDARGWLPVAKLQLVRVSLRYHSLVC